MKVTRELVIILILGFIALLIVKNLLAPIVFSIVFSYIFFPIHKKMSEKIGKRTSAMIIVVVLLLFILTLVLYFSQNLYSIASKISYSNNTILKNEIVQKIEEKFMESFLSGITNFLASISKFLIDLTVFFFLMYYFLVDYEAFIDFLRTNFPEEDLNFLLDTIKKVFNSIIYGHFVASFFQFILCYIVFAIFRVPYALFLSILAFFLALMGLSPALVYVPVGVWKIYVGDIFAGSMILGIGIFIISTVDNYIKPKVASKVYDLHPALYLISITGGIYTLGFVGMFIGPMVFGLLKAVIMYAKAKGMENKH